MPVRNHHRPGDWLYSCQQCGFTVWASETKRQWDGLRTCSKCFDVKHPQLAVRGRKDYQAVPFSNKPAIKFYYPYGEPQPPEPPDPDPIPDGALTDETGAYLMDSSGAYLIAS